MPSPRALGRLSPRELRGRRKRRGKSRMIRGASGQGEESVGWQREVITEFELVEVQDLAAAHTCLSFNRAFNAELSK